MRGTENNQPMRTHGSAVGVVESPKTCPALNHDFFSCQIVQLRVKLYQLTCGYSNKFDENRPAVRGGARNLTQWSHTNVLLIQKISFKSFHNSPCYSADR